MAEHATDLFTAIAAFAGAGGGAATGPPKWPPAGLGPTLPGAVAAAALCHPGLGTAVCSYLCAFTTTVSESRVSYADNASATVKAGFPTGTRTLYSRKISLAWYSCIFIIIGLPFSLLLSRPDL